MLQSIEQQISPVPMAEWNSVRVGRARRQRQRITKEQLDAIFSKLPVDGAYYHADGSRYQAKTFEAGYEAAEVPSGA